MLGITLLVLSALVGNIVSAPAQAQNTVIDGVEWSVKDLTRVCTDYPSACTYNFTIVPGGYTPDANCTIVDKASDSVHDSLVSVPCNNAYGNSWVISWGYNADYDFAVMTIVNEVEKQDAWFGYNCVSTTSDFEDVGPNKVYALGTFT